MKKIILALTLGLIAITAEVAAFFMGQIDSNVLTGLLMLVIAPTGLYIAMQSTDSKVAKKSRFVLPMRKELAEEAEIEVHSQMSERPAVELREKNYIASL